jgi:hypothetical protein
MLKCALFAVGVLCFSVPGFAQNPVPFVNAPLVPATAAPGGAAFTLTVNGNGFVSGATVDWNGAPLNTTFVSASQLTALVPAADITATATASVTVVNPQNTTPSAAAFFQVAAKSPTVTFANAAGTPLSLAGNNPDPIEPITTVAGDFNGDGILDLAVETAYSPTPGYSIVVYLGKGDGTFTAGPTSLVPGDVPDYMVAADLTGNGKLDLVMSNFGGNTVTVLLGKGDGTFTVAPGFPLNAGNGTGAAAVGDFNHDGKLDLAIPVTNDMEIVILLGNGDGTFTPAAGSPIKTGLGVSAVAVGDFNGDGKLDLAASNLDFFGTNGQVLTVLLGNGDGTFTPAASPAAPYSFSLVAADFNGDGKLDLAVTDYEGNGVTILNGNGDGTFAAGVACCGTQVTGSHVIGINVGDFNADGKLDLVFSIFNQDSNSAYETTVLGNGDGTFTATNFSIAVSAIQSQPALGDFNGDGKLDIATVSDPYSLLAVLLQMPPGAPAPGFSLAPLNPSVTIPAGSTGMDFINLTSVNGFVGAVNVACSGLPAGATCSLSPGSQFLADGISPSVQLNLTTTARPTKTTAGSSASSGGRGLPGSDAGRLAPILTITLALTAALLLAAGFSMAGKKPARVHAFAFVPLLLLLVSIALLSSCGGGSGNNPGGGGGGVNPGTPAGTYTLTVTGTSGALTSSTTVTLLVQ